MDDMPEPTGAAVVAASPHGRALPAPNASQRHTATGRWGWTLALAALGTFLTALDIVVVSTALPTLRTHLHATLADLEWTINGYNLVFACLMLTGAALGDRFGRKRMYVLGVSIFTLASAAAALSSNTGELIVTRAIQGVGAAVVLPLTVTLVADVVPPARRAMAIGVLGGVAGLGVAAGPILGGTIVEGISWQWIFWINVPVGVAVAVLSALRLRESHGPRTQLDIPGLVLAGAGMFGLVWAAVRAPSVGWGSTEVVSALIAGAVLVVAFVAWERRTRYPMVPLAYFRRRGFATANTVGFLQQISLIGSLFMITQLFQIGMGYSPMTAGARILIWMAMPMFVAPPAGALAGRFGNRPLLVVGLIMQAAGLAWLAAVATTHGLTYATLIAPLVIAGIGISLCFPVVANAITDSVPFAEIGIASGANKATIEVGSVFGVAIMSAVFARSGSYASSSAFISGFRPAMFTAAAIAAAGLAAAVLVPAKPKADESAAAALAARPAS
jgi:EmrB/QacA subfamily drug resistance transporter